MMLEQILPAIAQELSQCLNAKGLTALSAQIGLLNVHSQMLRGSAELFAFQVHPEMSREEVSGLQLRAEELVSVLLKGKGRIILQIDTLGRITSLLVSEREDMFESLINLKGFINGRICACRTLGK